MKSLIAILSLLAFPGPVALQAQSRPATSDQQALVELERHWNTAFYSQNKDLAFIQNVLADEFLSTYDDGSRGDKARELSLAAAFDQQVDSAVQDDFVVKIYGDAAVVWFTLHLTGPSQGRPLQLTSRYVDVFVWRANRWQCVSSQSTMVTAK